MKPKLEIVKIGGNIIENEVELDKFLSLFANMEGFKILVHGGGKRATEIESRLGIASEYFQGRRITRAESLDVMIMVYAGLLNKKITAGLQGRDCNAIGLSGTDGGTILAEKRPVKDVDFGYVGDVLEVSSKRISNLLENQFVPVFCALTHDGSGQMFNTNADTIASEIAIGMSQLYETTLYYCFEKKGVLRDVSDENSVIPHINKKSYKELIENDIISDGMLPKLHNCFHALDAHVGKICIGNTSMFERGGENYTSITL